MIYSCSRVYCQSTSRRWARGGRGGCAQPIIQQLNEMELVGAAAARPLTDSKCFMPAPVHEKYANVGSTPAPGGCRPTLPDRLDGLEDSALAHHRQGGSLSDPVCCAEGRPTQKFSFDNHIYIHKGTVEKLHRKGRLQG